MINFATSTADWTLTPTYCKSSSACDKGYLGLPQWTPILLQSQMGPWPQSQESRGWTHVHGQFCGINSPLNLNSTYCRIPRPTCQRLPWAAPTSPKSTLISNGHTIKRLNLQICLRTHGPSECNSIKGMWFTTKCQTGLNAPRLESLH